MLAIVLLQTQVCADPPRMNLDTKWSYNMGKAIRDIQLTDTTNDGKNEIIIGLENNSVITLNSFGRKINEFSLGNASAIGSIYCMYTADVDEDGENELIFGLGGAKQTRTYDPHGFTIDTEDSKLIPSDKVLYRVIRYSGGVQVTEKDGTLVWRYLTLDSVKAISYVRTEKDGGFVVAGVGDQALYTYNELTTKTETGKVCSTEEITDEMSGWTNQTLCEDPSKCCAARDGCYDCVSKWDAEDEVCYRSYSQTTCGIEETTGDEEWHYITYKNYTSDVVLLDKNGRQTKKIQIISKDPQTGKAIPDADSTVRAIATSKREDNINPEFIIATNSGEVTAFSSLNISGLKQIWMTSIGNEIRAVSSEDINDDSLAEVIAGNSLGVIYALNNKGETIWKQRVDDAITDICPADVESDSTIDVVVASRDMRIYAYDASGTILWTQYVGEPIYGMIVEDLDDNELQDFIVYTTGNVTRYQANEYYIKKFRADKKYNEAYESFEIGDYTKASIYVDMAKEMYEQINDKDNIPRCDLLRKSIDEEFKLKNKKEADRYYNLALEYYTAGNLETALDDISNARTIYEKLGDDTGVKKCDDFKQTITEDRKSQQKLIADGYYTKSVSLSNFENYTEALKMLDEAKRIYESIGHYNETIRCDMLVLSFAERHMKLAERAYESADYEKTISYAAFAEELYDKLGREDGKVNAAELANNAREAIKNNTGEKRQNTDYTTYIIVAAVILTLVFIYTRIKPNIGVRSTQTREFDDEERLISLEEDKR